MLSNRSMPEQTLIPVLGYPDVDAAVDWLCAAFDFTERWRIGDHRAQLGVGEGAAVAISRAEAVPNVGNVDHVMVRVENVDSHLARARANGAEIITEASDHSYGERQYTARDHSGRPWVFTQSIADVAPEEWGGDSSGSNSG